MSHWIAISIFVSLTVLYCVGVYFLFRLKTKYCLCDYHSKSRSDYIREKYNSLKVYEDADRILEKDPQNEKLRAEIITARSLDSNTYPLEKAAEHAWWFLENSPLHPVLKTDGEMAITLNSISKKVYDETTLKVLAVWKRHLSQHPNDITYLRAAAQSLIVTCKEESKKIWEKIHKEYPFCAESNYQLSKLEEWEINHDVLYIHPTKECSTAYNLSLIRLRWPWDESKSSKLTQLKFEYGKLIFPNWLCFLILYIDGFLNWDDRPWNNYYFVSELGILAYQCGDYAFSKKCEAQFLKLQPEAQARHNHLPLYATGFNLAIMLALKEENFQKLQYYIEKRSEDEADSEFSFHCDIALLIDLVRCGRSDIAVNFMKKRARNYLSDPNIASEIAFIENGGKPYTKEYYDWLKRRSD